MLKIPHQLKKILEQFKASVVDNVSGVMCIKAQNPGPVLGITACTHGNEPSGLAIFSHLLNEMDIASTLQCGTLYLVVNNIEATENFFRSATEQEISEARYKDVNMNRLPNDVLTTIEDRRYEVIRTQELFPIWRQFTVGLDIHSTTMPTIPMIISRGGKFVLIEGLIRGFPIDILISNIDQIQIGIPAFAVYGGIKNEIPVFSIEAGQHTEIESFERAVRCSVSLLQNLGMLPGVPNVQVGEYKECCVGDSIRFADLSFDFISDFKSYDIVSAGQLLAQGSVGNEVRAPFDGHLLFPIAKRGEDKDISEEVAFVSHPVQIRRVG